MGLFDSVYVACPHCSKTVEFQSKEWNCDMTVYSLETAPTAILYDIINYPNHCEKCDGWFALVDPKYPPGPRPRPDLVTARVRSPETPGTHPQGMKWWPEDKTFSYADLTDPDSIPHPPI
jgi:hypothetical protein